MAFNIVPKRQNFSKSGPTVRRLQSVVKHLNTNAKEVQACAKLGKVFIRWINLPYLILVKWAILGLFLFIFVFAVNKFSIKMP